MAASQASEVAGLLPESPARAPIRAMFVATTLPVGGAETLLFNMVRRFDRRRIAAEVCCLRDLGPLGELLSADVPTHHSLLGSKWDIAVWARLHRLFRERKCDAVVTVGTGGDKMFWGRLAAWTAGVPVIVSALHSTGLPDHVEWSNRRLRRLNDAFIALADHHAAYLASHEGCPADKIRVVRNGVDVARFRPLAASEELRRELRIGDGPVASILAALRMEKNHKLFLEVAARLRKDFPTATFLIIGDGVERAGLEKLAGELGIHHAVRFLGTRSDVPELLALTDVLVLSSIMEASPVSLLEGMACGKPVVATNVGSISESVKDGETGFLVPAGDAEAMTSQISRLFRDTELRNEFGRAGRRFVEENASLDSMVEGYTVLLEDLCASKNRHR